MDVIATLLESREESLADLPLSVSKVKTFSDCKLKYRYCYIEKLPRKEWDFHVTGKFAHEILETFHKQLLDEPNLEFNYLMTECFKNSAKNFNLTKDQKNEVFGFCKTYLDILNKQRKNDSLPEILAVEKGFYVDIDGTILLNGFIDRVQRDKDGVIHVADYKTTKNKRYLKDFFQLLTYAFVLMLEDESLKKIRASFILLRHNFEYLTEEYTRKDVLKVAKSFLQYAEKIKEEKIWRPNPSRLCSYCDYLDLCDSGKDYLKSIGKFDGPENYGKSAW